MLGNDDIVTPGGDSSQSNPYMFTGRRLDAETGLYYYRHRYFHPKLGRFIHRDPIDNWENSIDTGNSYIYVGNNSPNWVDNLGLRTVVNIWDSGAVPGINVGHTSLQIGDDENPREDYVSFWPEEPAYPWSSLLFIRS